MAEEAQRRADVRRRKLLMKSDERMKKLLGPHADISTKPESQYTNIKNEEVQHAPMRIAPSQSPVAQKIRDHTFLSMKNKGKSQPPESSWYDINISEMVLFPIGMIVRAFPMLFVPIFAVTSILILVQTSSTPSMSFWVAMVCNQLAIDPRKSYSLKVFALLEKTVLLFLMFSFSFILTHALVMKLGIS